MCLDTELKHNYPRYCFHGRPPIGILTHFDGSNPTAKCRKYLFHVPFTDKDPGPNALRVFLLYCQMSKPYAIAASIFSHPWLQAKLGANLCSKLFILRKSCIKRKKIRDNGKQIKDIKILLQ